MRHATLAVLTAAALLAACGGHNDSTPATSEVPSSASETIDNFIEYLKELVASDADTLEPVDTAAVTGPTDETSDPKAVD